MTIDEYRAGLHAWTRQSSVPNLLERKGVELKVRGRTFKSAGLNKYGRDVDSPSKIELELKESPLKQYGLGYDFDHPDNQFKLVDEEVRVLQRFLNGEFEEEGYYVRTDSKELAEVLAERVANSSLDAATINALLGGIAENKELLAEIVESKQATVLTDIVQHRQRLKILDELEAASNTPGTDEKVFQKILQENPWIFGGEFVTVTQRRQIVVLDELDVPLVTTDGRLHIAELKRADISKLVVPYRNHPAVGSDAHFAVAQAQNYLFGLDCEADSIQRKLSIDAHRSFATVVIGNISLNSPEDISDEDCRNALQIYNSHLSRVRLLTYDQLIAHARNALQFGEHDSPIP